DFLRATYVPYPPRIFEVTFHSADAKLLPLLESRILLEQRCPVPEKSEPVGRLLVVVNQQALSLQPVPCLHHPLCHSRLMGSVFQFLGQCTKTHVTVFKHRPEVSPIQPGMLIYRVESLIAFQVRE